jgi:hypothetical protein
MTLSTGLKLKKGDRVGVDSCRMWDEAYHNEPMKYDPERFLRMRGHPGKEHLAQLVTTSANHLGFGYVFGFLTVDRSPPLTNRQTWRAQLSWPLLCSKRGQSCIVPHHPEIRVEVGTRNAIEADNDGTNGELEPIYQDSYSEERGD